MFSELTTSGIIFITIAWSSVIALVAFCIIKVLKSENQLKESEN